MPSLPNRRMLTIQRVTLIWSFLVSSLALGYTSSPTSSNRPFVHPLDLQEIQAMRRTTAATNVPTKEEATKTITKREYDLGIGKNPPLINKRHQRHDPLSPPASLYQSSFQNDHDASDKLSTTRYLVEHDATREYPSPLQPAMVVRPPKPQPSQPRVLPKVQHERRVQDALQIDHPLYHSAGNLLDGVSTSEARPPSGTPLQPTSSVLPLIRPSSKVQLDVNTVWVEMMLHSEQMKSISMIPSAAVV